MSIVYGLHAVESLLKHQSQTITHLYLDAKRQDSRLESLRLLAKNQGVAFSNCDKTTLDKKSQQGRHQGVVALTQSSSQEIQQQPLEQLLQNLEKPALLLVLDGITDPHNLGACLRSADAAGVDAVIIPKDKSVSLNATVRKVACGAADTVPLYTVTNLARILKQLKQWGVWVFGTAGEAEQLIYQSDLTTSCAIVMGREGKGLRRLTRQECDSLVKLPMAGAVSSLNVSVASGICLFEAVRQRQA